MSDERGRMSSVLGITGVVLGNVQGQGDFEVRGRVQGDIILSGRVLVAGGGMVLGTIEALQITVSGTVRGDLIAEDGVEITGGGQVEGNVTSPRVAIEAGAKVRGHLRTGEEPPAAVRSPKIPLEADLLGPTVSVSFDAPLDAAPFDARPLDTRPLGARPLDAVSFAPSDFLSRDSLSRSLGREPAERTSLDRDAPIQAPAKAPSKSPRISVDPFAVDSLIADRQLDTDDTNELDEPLEDESAFDTKAPPASAPDTAEARAPGGGKRRKRRRRGGGDRGATDDRGATGDRAAGDRAAGDRATGDRGATGESAPRADGAPSNLSLPSDARPRESQRHEAHPELVPPARPTRPSGPLPPANTEAKEPRAGKPQRERSQADQPQRERSQADQPQRERSQADQPQRERSQADQPQGERPRRGKPLPTFVKGARGHLRG